MTDKIYWSDLPEGVQSDLVDWLEEEDTQKKLDELEKKYEVIMLEYNCSREEAIQRHFLEVLDNSPQPTGTWKIKCKKYSK